MLNHDQLLGWDQQDGAHSKVRVDPKLQVEAQRLAKKQAEKLRQSREQVLPFSQSADPALDSISATQCSDLDWKAWGCWCSQSTSKTKIRECIEF